MSFGGESIFKTTLLSSTISQRIISLSFSPSSQCDCFKYFFHGSSLPKLSSKYKNIIFKYSANSYSKPEKCSMLFFPLLLFSSFYSFIWSHLYWLLNWKNGTFFLFSSHFCFLTLERLRCLPWNWRDLIQSKLSLWVLGFRPLCAGYYHVQAYGRDVTDIAQDNVCIFYLGVNYPWFFITGDHLIPWL